MLLFLWCWQSQDGETVVFCHLCLVWRGPFNNAFVCACVCNMPICVHACTGAWMVNVCVFVCACVSPHLPSGHGFIKHFINVKHHLQRQIKLAHTHTYTLRQRPTHMHKQRQEKPRRHVHNGMTTLELCPVNYSITHIRTGTQTHIKWVMWIHIDMCQTQFVSRAGKRQIFHLVSVCMYAFFCKCV